jgi:predicted alpha-1,6-mannanase (GH76 family)
MSRKRPIENDEICDASLGDHTEARKAHRSRRRRGTHHRGFGNRHIEHRYDIAKRAIHRERASSERTVFEQRRLIRHTNRPSPQPGR